MSTPSRDNATSESKARLMMLFRWPTHSNADWLGPLMSVMHTQNVRQTASLVPAPDWFRGIALDVVLLEGPFVTVATLYDESSDSIQVLMTTFDEPGNRLLLANLTSYFKAWGAKFLTGKAQQPQAA